MSELRSTLYLVSSYYSSYFCPVPARRIPPLPCIREPRFALCTNSGFVSHLHRCNLPYAFMTHIPQLACYASRERRTLVKLYCLLRAHPSAFHHGPSSLSPLVLSLGQDLAKLLSVARQSLSGVTRRCPIAAPLRDIGAD